MSTITSTAAAPASIPAFVIPIVEGYAKAMRDPISFLMIGTVLSAMLVPLLIALFAFSTPQTRRTPIFIVVVLQVLLGLALGAWNAAIMLHVILSPLGEVAPSNNMAFTLTFAFAPWFIDVVLFLRLLVVYPAALASTRKRVAVFALPVMLKLGRIATLAVFAVQWRKSTNNLPTGDISSVQGLSFTHAPALKVEWVCQVVDNSYVTTMFLWRLRGTFVKRRGGLLSTDGTDKFSTRIRTLFWIAATNFVFPVIFNAAQIVALFICPFFVSVRVAIVNIYISIIGAVFCCVWSSRSTQACGKSPAVRSHVSATSVTLSTRETRPDVAESDEKTGLHDIPLRLVDVDVLHTTAAVQANAVSNSV